MVDGEEPLRSLQEIGAVHHPRPLKAIFYDGGNGESERAVSFPSSTLWFINSPVIKYFQFSPVQEIFFIGMADVGDQYQIVRFWVQFPEESDRPMIYTFHQGC